LFFFSFCATDDYAETASRATVTSVAGEPYNLLIAYENSDVGSLLPTAQRVSVTASPQLAVIDADFRYSYDHHFRPVSVAATVGGRALATQLLAYDDATGRLTRSSPFLFDRPHAHRELTRDVNVEIVRELDSHGRLTDVWYRFNNHVVFTVETKFTPSGQVCHDLALLVITGKGRQKVTFTYTALHLSVSSLQRRFRHRQGRRFSLGRSRPGPR